MRAATTDQNTKLIELTSDQWQFLRGIYAMNPEAPPGLPDGDKAVFRLGGGDSDGLLFFVDGDKACTPMNAPPALLSLMDQIAADVPSIKGPACKRRFRSADQRMRAERSINFRPLQQVAAWVLVSCVPISDIDHGWRLSQRGS